MSGLDRSAIEDVQTRLAALGLYLGEIDGVNETAMRQALRAFQASKGIEPSGLLNEPTRVALLRARVPKPVVPSPVDPLPASEPTHDPGTRRRFGRR